MDNTEYLTENPSLIEINQKLDKIVELVETINNTTQRFFYFYQVVTSKLYSIKEKVTGVVPDVSSYKKSTINDQD